MPSVTICTVGGQLWPFGGSTGTDFAAAWARPAVALCPSRCGCQPQGPQKTLEVALWADPGALVLGYPVQQPASEPTRTEKKRRNFIVHTTGGQPWGQDPVKFQDKNLALRAVLVMKYILDGSLKIAFWVFFSPFKRKIPSVSRRAERPGLPVSA